MAKIQNMYMYTLLIHCIKLMLLITSDAGLKKEMNISCFVCAV